MATINLREYVDKVQRLIGLGSTDEAVYHCRHILKYFPRNAAVYRLLARALIEKSSYAEAAEVYRRILSVYPDDYESHSALGDFNQRQRKYEDAIWHYERAFEAQPNNQQLIQTLRDLYLEHRKIETPKIQLTAGAVARQYVRNGLYDQAVDVLRQAVQRFPDRVDLLLLLAKTEWDAERPVDAAETALDVLNKLPDSLEANRILSELWLGEDRPSDAQRYLSRIEAVDPYLALQLAKGVEAEDDALQLEEADYEAFAARELSTARPDWLSDLGELPIDEDTTELPKKVVPEEVNLDDDNWLDSFDQEIKTAEPAAPKASDTNTDWLTTITNTDQTVSMSKEDLEAAKAAAAKARQQSSTPMTPPPPEWLQGVEQTPEVDLFGELEETPGKESTGFTGFLEEIGDEAPSADEMPDWLSQPAQAMPGDDAEDPFAWMQQSGVELHDEPTESPLTPVDEGSQVRASEDPLAWMNRYDDAVLEEGEEDPFAWMKSSGVEVADDQEESPAPAAAQTTAPAKPEAPTFADDDLLQEMLDVEALSSGGAWEAPAVEQASPEEDFVPRMDDYRWTDELPHSKPAVTPDVPQSEPAAEIEPTGNTDDGLAWMTDLDEPEIATSSAERSFETGELSWPATQQAAVQSSAPEEKQFETGDLGWWGSQGEQTSSEQSAPEYETGDLGWAVPAEPTPEPIRETFNLDEPDPAVEEDPFAWMGEMGVELTDAEPTTVEDAALPASGSLADALPEETHIEPATGGVLGWLSDEEQTPAVEGVEQDADPFAWMDEMGVELSTDQPAEQEALPTLGSMLNNPAEDDALTWMAQSETEDEDEISPAPEALIAAPEAAPDWMSEAEEAAVSNSDMPDWLSDMGSDDDFSKSEPEADDGFNWLSSEPADQPTPAGDAFEGDVPDWLSDMGASESAAKSEPAAASADTGGFDWLSSGDQAAASAAPAASSDMPDWLSDMGALDDDAAAEAEPAAATADTGGFDWLSGADDEEEAVAATPAVSDTPDWLSDMGALDEDEATEPEPAAASADTGGFDWLSGEEEEAVAATPAASDTPDWLSDMGALDEDEAQAEPAAASADTGGFDWLSGADDEEEVVAATPAASDTPDWLSDMGALDEDEAAEPEPAAASADTGGFDWLSGEEEEEAVAATPAASDTPDWLSDMGALDEDEAQAEPAAASADTGGFDWLADDDDQQVEEAQVASTEMPDWMSEMGAPAVNEESTPVAETPSWLSNDEEDEETEFAPAMELSEEDEQALDWMNFGGEIETEPEMVQATPSAEMPDWLSEASPLPFDDAQETVSSTAEQEQFAYNDDFDNLTYPAVASIEEELEPAPAGNAPDWLNAMVPGLDVDYAAEEDQAVEQSFAAAPPGKLDWLNEIVEEESQHLAPVAQAPMTLPTALPKRRFVFTRPPAWLRSASAAPVSAVASATTSAAAAPAKDDMPDWLRDNHEDDDNSNDDLPDWLK